MKARPDFTVDTYDNSCRFQSALRASNMLEQLRPIIGDDQFKQLATGSYSWDHTALDVGVEDAIVKCLRHIRKIRGGFKDQHRDRNHLNLNQSFTERTQRRLHEHTLQLSTQFNFCRLKINWGERPNIRIGHVVGNHKPIMIDAPYGYSKQIEAELAWVENKVVGPYSDIEESPDGIKTARCQYAKMDKYHNWYVHDGFLAWMPHDECIKVKALGDDREKAERAARSAARREVLAALG